MTVIPDARRCVFATTSVQGMDVLFTWTADPSATSYRLEIGSTSGATDVFFQDIGNVTSYTINDMLPGSYYWVVRTMTGGTPGAASAEQVFYV